MTTSIVVEIDISKDKKYCGECHLMDWDWVFGLCDAFNKVPEWDEERQEPARLPECIQADNDNLTRDGL